MLLACLDTTRTKKNRYHKEKSKGSVSHGKTKNECTRTCPRCWLPLHDKMVADQLGVTGSVKNEDDGSVSITAIAPEDIMETFIKNQRFPSPAGRVTYVDIQEDPLLEETEQFKVIQ